MPRKPPREESRLAAQRRLGARIRNVREELGWGQRRAADAFGFRSASAVSNLEQGLNGVDAIDLWNYARETQYPIEYFLNPNFDEHAPSRPRTLLEWKVLFGGDTRLAEAHYSLDRAIADPARGQAS